MRKLLYKQFWLLCIIACLAIYSPLHAQQNPPTDVNMSWVNKIYSPGGNFLDIKNYATKFFQQYPDYDTNAELKNIYQEWQSFRQPRSHWVDSASKPGDVNSALIAMENLANIPKMTSNSPYPSDWKLISPLNNLNTQNLGIITCSWTDNYPNDNHILIGTEASGLWETRDYGVTWHNLTDSYTNPSSPPNNTIPIGFGVSSIVVKKGVGFYGLDVIAITTFLPSTDLALGHGLGMLISKTSGASWYRRPIINSLTGANISPMSWKIINAETSSPEYVYASCQDNKVYKVNIVSINYSNVLIFDLQTYGGICEDPIAWFLKNRIRDMEIVEIGAYKSLFITTDGFVSNQIKCNARIFYTNLSLPYVWNEIIPAGASSGLIDNIAVEGIVTDLGSIRTCYFAYDIIQLGTNNNVTDNEIFYIDKYQAADANLNTTWSKVLTYNKPHTSNYTVGNDFAGFGYRYDAFSIRNENEIYVGGYELYKVNMANSNLVRLNAQGSPSQNNQYHYGIRSIDLIGNKLYMSTEGGISLFDLINSTFTNINGTGLAILQVSDMSTTINSNFDFIVHNSHRNGIWAKACGPWENLWWNDGGNYLLDEKDRDQNDFGQPDYVHNSGAGSYTRFLNCLGNTDQPVPFNEWNFDAPIVFSDHNNNTIYQGRHNIYQSDNQGITWDVVTDIQNGYPVEADWWQGCLKVIKVAPNNPNIMYIAFQGYGNINGNATTPYLNKIYRGIKTGNTWNWFDLSAGINTITTPAGEIFKWTAITDIAINPNDPYECWVTLDQFWGSIADIGTYRVLHFKNGIWHDFSNGLTSSPVNCIVLNEASNVNELFVGTDVGVFYCNASASTPKWELFHNNNPQWIVTDLEINYKQMKLRAATWGRSIWETKIKCSVDAPVDYTISTDEIINQPVPNCGDIVVNNGATLTINNTVIEMAEDKTITVLRGGKLLLNNSTIKGYCQSMWEGIIIDGNNFSHQLSNDQAYLQSNSSTIEDALIAVKSIDLNYPDQTKGGGRINAVNTTFKNNQIAVKFLPYVHFDLLFDENLSTFKKCNFITDAPLVRMPLKPIAFVQSESIYGLNILGCKFENTNVECNGYTYEGIGIDAKMSDIIVEEYCSATLSPGGTCPAADLTPSVFSYLKFGIKAVGSNEKFSVKHTTFTENLRGLYMDEINNFNVISNTFYLPNYYSASSTPPVYDGSHEQYGAYLNSCIVNYHFENNLFSFNPNNPASGIGFIGLYINNSDKSFKLIYNNTFNFLQYGIVALGYNRPQNVLGYDGGLKIKCNDFIDCDNNIVTVNDPNLTNPQGIGYYQGHPNPILTTQPAGNTFKTTANSNSGSTYFYNETSQINYTSHNDAITRPIEAAQLGFTTKFQSNQIFNKAISCPTTPGILPLNPINVSMMYSLLSSAQQQLNSARLILTIWTDGGNTEALKQAVDLALPYEAYDLYNNLISKSPYLSEEVLIKAIENEDVLAPLLLKMVLLANPQSGKSDRIMQALYNRINPFPQEWIDEIKNGSNFITPMEQLQGEVDYCAMERQLAFNNLKSSYLLDSSEEYADSLYTLLKRENRFETDIELLYFYSNNKNFEASEEIVQLIPEKYDVSGELADFWESTLEIYAIIKELKSNDKEISEMDDNFREILRRIINENKSTAVAAARTLLLMGDADFVYQEPIILPIIESQNKAVNAEKQKSPEKLNLSVYPNPAHDFATLNYAVTEPINGLQLMVCDAMGKTVYSKMLNNTKDQLLINLKEYAKGNYIASIFNNGKTIKSCKFVIE